MIQETMEAIAVKLNSIFGDEYEIYQDHVKQGLKEPCFFIAVLKPEIIPLVGQRFIEQNPFDIQYFPKKQGDNVELFTVAQKLISAMDFITLLNGDLLHGTNISYEVIDDVLHFFVNYKIPMRKNLEKSCMEALETDVRTEKE